MAIQANNLVFAIFVLFIFWVAIRLIERFLQSLAERYATFRLKVKSFIPIVRVILWFFAFASFFKILFPSREDFIGLLVAIGLAFGLAVRDALANLIGGLIILINRPYIVGDRVEIGEHYGEIVELGLISTRLQTPGDSIVTIPNSIAVNEAISNANSGQLHCQVQIPLYISTRAPIDEARDIAMEAVISSPWLNPTLPVKINVRERWQDGAYIELNVKAYVFDARNEFDFMTDVTRRFKDHYQGEDFRR